MSRVSKTAILTLLAARQLKALNGSTVHLHTQRDPTKWVSGNNDLAWVTEWNEQYHQWTIWDRGVFEFRVSDDVLDVFERGILAQKAETAEAVEAK